MTRFEHSAQDSAMGAETPEGIEFVLYPAGFLIRACAWAIDCFIQCILLFAILITAGLLSLVMGSWFILILVFILDWFYNMAFEIFGQGQSPGKRFMGIRVVRRDGSPINGGASFIRNLLRFADTFMFLYHIAFFSMLASRGFRRLGDLAGDTLVVYTVNVRTPGRFTSPALRRPGMPWLADIPMVSASPQLNYEEKQAVLMFARRYPILGKERADEIAGIWTDKLIPPSSDSETRAAASDILLGIARSIAG